MIEFALKGGYYYLKKGKNHGSGHNFIIENTLSSQIN